MTAVFSAVALGKQYPRPTGGALAAVRRRRAAAPWALRHVDLDVAAGELVAVIGRNGAGKSTLMKLAAGVSRPTEGRVRRPPRVAPLIEVGAGFHPELTGRENVEVNGRLLGLSAREVTGAFDSIVEFAELGAVIDEPVRHYSSGMFMRLGFSVAVHTAPELLIVDEVLAVGDLSFQVRCLDRIRELRSNGVGVLFVSHNLATVLEMADRALLLDHGQPLVTGEPGLVVGTYHRLLRDPADERNTPQGVDNVKALRLDSIVCDDVSGAEPPLWSAGQHAHLRLCFTAEQPTNEATVGFLLQKEGAGLASAWQGLDGPVVPALQAGETVIIDCTLALNVGPGRYSLDVGIVQADWHTALFYDTDLARFAVTAPPGSRGHAYLNPRVEVLR